MLFKITNNFIDYILQVICPLFVSKTFIALLLLCPMEYANAEGVEYKVKAAFLFQFTKFTEWPINSFDNNHDPIRICVLGNNPFGKLLDNLDKRKSQNRPLTIEYLKLPLDISHCHLVYISRSEDKNLNDILKLTENTSVLTVSDMNDFVRRGGIIGLVVDKRKIRIEINFSVSNNVGVKLSSKLLEIATLVIRK